MLNKLEFSVTITADKILRAESNYYETIMHIASVKRDHLRSNSFIEKHKGVLKKLIFGLCVAGVVLIVIDLLPYGYCQPNYLQDFILLLFFILIFVGLKKEDALATMFWAKCNRYIADIKTEATFKLARRLIPFEACYTLDGKNISYARIKGGEHNKNWSREISGEYLVCDDYVITYKPKQLYPDLFILIGSSAELAGYLDGLGLKRIEM